MTDAPHNPAPPPPRPRGRGCCLFVASGFALGMIAMLVVLIYLAGYVPALFAGGIGFGPGVAVLDVRGELSDERPILEDLDYLVSNPSTKALVVRVDSPGGVVTVMEEVHGALVRVKKERELPVIASVGTVAASGGYFICLAADRIYANATSLTGSIGAAFEYYNAEELLDKIGVDHEMIDSGPFKAMGSIAEPMTERQRAQMQDVVDDVEASFVEVLEEARSMAPEKAEALADGRVFTGRQAVELGLVDEVGDLHDAVTYAAAQAGLGEDYRVIRIPRETHIQFRWLDWLGALGHEFRPTGILPKYVVR